MKEVFSQFLSQYTPIEIAGVIVSLFIAVFFVWQLWKLQSNLKDYPTFDFADLIYDPKTKQINDSKFRLTVAFFLMTWAFLYLTLAGKLTEWYVTVYAAAFVADRISSRLSRSDNNGGSDDNPPSNIQRP